MDTCAGAGMLVGARVQGVGKGFARSVIQVFILFVVILLSQKWLTCEGYSGCCVLLLNCTSRILVSSAYISQC